MEMTKVDNRSLSDFEMFHEKLETLLHPKHYLMIMLKRHLVQLYSSVLAQLDDEDLERVNCNFITFHFLTDFDKYFAIFQEVKTPIISLQPMK